MKKTLVVLVAAALAAGCNALDFVRYPTMGKEKPANGFMWENYYGEVNLPKFLEQLDNDPSLLEQLVWKGDSERGGLIAIGDDGKARIREMPNDTVNDCKNYLDELRQGVRNPIHLVYLSHVAEERKKVRGLTEEEKELYEGFKRSFKLVSSSKVDLNELNDEKREEVLGIYGSFCDQFEKWAVRSMYGSDEVVAVRKRAFENIVAGWHTHRENGPSTLDEDTSKKIGPEMVALTKDTDKGKTVTLYFVKAGFGSIVRRYEIDKDNKVTVKFKY